MKVSPPQKGKPATSQTSPSPRKKKVSLAELSRKIDILIGVLVQPQHVAAVKAGLSVDDALRAEACRLAVRTGDYSYVFDYQEAKNKKQHGTEPL